MFVFFAFYLSNQSQNTNQQNVLNQYISDKPGMSAYELAVKNGFSGTEVEYLASLHGADSKSTHSVKEVEVQTQVTKEVHTIEQVPVNGQSSYDLWLSLGNVGTQQDYLLSLKGKDGATVTTLVRYNEDLGKFQTKLSTDTFWKVIPVCGGTSGKVCN